MNEDSREDGFNRPMRRRWDLFPLIATSIAFTAVVVAVCSGAYFAGDILIVLFLGVLFAIFLTRTSGPISRTTHCPYKAALAIVLAITIGLATGFVLLFGFQVRSEFERSLKHIEQAKSELSRTLDDNPTAAKLLEEIPLIGEWFGLVLDKGPEPNGQTQSSDEQTQSSDKTDGIKSSNASGDLAGTSQSMGGLTKIGGSIVAAIRSMLNTTFGLVINFLIIFFVGLFLAAEPEASRDGLVQLAPPRDRDEVRRVFNSLGGTLWNWLIGRFASMIISGTGVGISLALLGVPMAATLGIVTGILTFVPNIGAALALGLAMFAALPSGMTTVAWVVAIYLGFQLVESYVVTPLIDQHQVNLPPALLIAIQAIFGVALGFLGAMIASPFLVVCLVLHKEVYQKHLNSPKAQSG